MKIGLPSCLLWTALTAVMPIAVAQNGSVRVPKTVAAGSAFTAVTSGTGEAVLYLVGPAQVLRRTVQLGQSVSFNSTELHNAGHYLVFLSGNSTSETQEFDVVAARQPASLSFLARPSRLPIDQPDAISGVAYVFDVFGNLMLEPSQVSFQISGNGAPLQTRTESTRNGVAWVKMNSSPKAGAAKFQASAGGVVAERMLQQVPGEPCNLSVSAKRSGKRILLETAPVNDCRGNSVPDGTVITFTETSGDGTSATVDVPLKRGVAKTDMPAYRGAAISVATGLVMGNVVRVGDGE